MKIETLCVGDNFIYVWVEGDHAAVVDPGVAEPVQTLLRDRGWRLDLILLTHYHADHTAGCAALKEAGCEIVGPADGPMPVDRALTDGTTLAFAGHRIEVLAVPGHTAHDVAYYLPQARAVFTGDVLFACGCGRMFERDPEQMWQSLCRLRALPDDTRVYGGHDYTRENLEFARHVDPANAALAERWSRWEAQPESAWSSTLAEEKATNPFLRCDGEALRDAVGQTGGSAVEVFAAVRGLKDRW